MNTELSRDWFDLHTCYETSGLLQNITPPFPQEVGEGYEFEHNGVPYTTRGNRKDGKREIVFEITSFVGTCWNARHYYCRAHVWNNIINKKNGYTCYGTIERKIPYDKRTSYFDLCFPLTREMIKEDPERWEGYGEGDNCTAFPSKESITELIEKMKPYFEGWEITTEDMS